MKKLLLVLPAMLALAACGGAAETSSSGASSTSSPTSTGTSKSTPAGPTVTDITITLTASGIETYEDNHAFIWINCDFLGTSSVWESEKLVQDSSDQNKWSIVLHDFELEQALSYNFVYGTETAPDWTNGKQVSESEYQTLITEEGKTSYDVTATFYVPSSTGTVDVKYYVNPKVVATDGGAEVDLNDGVYVWAWNNLDDNTVRLEKQDDGTWLYAKDDVDLLDGVAHVQLTCVLGNQFSADWNYKQGAWESHEWVPFNNGVSYDFTDEEQAHTDNVFFNGQPDVAGVPLTLYYYDFDDNPISDWSTSVWVNYSYTEPSMSGESTWIGNLEYDDDTNTYGGTLLFTQKVYIEIQIWLGGGTRHVGSTLTNRFEVDFTAAEASFKVSVVYETLADYYVGTVSDAVGCTVK